MKVQCDRCKKVFDEHEMYKVDCFSTVLCGECSDAFFKWRDNENGA